MNFSESSHAVVPNENLTESESESRENFELQKQRALIILSAHIMNVSIESISKRADGFYDVYHTSIFAAEGDELRHNVLDLDFPFSKESVGKVIERDAEEGRETCLVVGPGTNSLTKMSVERATAEDVKRSFIVSEMGFGIPGNFPENLKDDSETGIIENSSYGISSQDISFYPKEHWHLFSRLDLRDFPKDSMVLILLSLKKRFQTKINQFLMPLFSPFGHI